MVTIPMMVLCRVEGFVVPVVDGVVRVIIGGVRYLNCQKQRVEEEMRKRI